VNFVQAALSELVSTAVFGKTSRISDYDKPWGINSCGVNKTFVLETYNILVSPSEYESNQLIYIYIYIFVTKVVAINLDSFNSKLRF
jgi:hypothetical protein